MSHRQGFTLIELLVVIAIIALLSSVVLSSLNSARAKARDARRYADLNQIQTALEMYFDTYNSYPTTGMVWRTVCNNAVSSVGYTFTTTGASGYIPNLAPTFIPVLPTDPSGCTSGYGFYNGYIYKSNGVDYKIATDWSSDIGAQCLAGSGFTNPQSFADPNRYAAYGGVHLFCSLYTAGAALW